MRIKLIAKEIKGMGKNAKLVVIFYYYTPMILLLSTQTQLFMVLF